MKLKAIFAALIALAAALCLCACGDAPEECGTYYAAAASADGESVSLSLVCPKGASLELLPAGKGRIRMGDESGLVSWRLDGTALCLKAEGAEYGGRLENGVITLNMPSGVELFFLKEGAEAPEVYFPGSDESRLCGGWYGWWRISNAAEDSELKDTWYDCCGRIEALSGGMGRLILWDEDGSAAEPMAVVSIRLEEDSGESVSGFFWNKQLSDGEWRLDPNGADFENMLYLSGRYGDEFEYTICLRPWGTDWGDVQAAQPDMLPFFYESWYKPLMDAGSDMPDSIEAP